MHSTTLSKMESGTLAIGLAGLLGAKRLTIDFTGETTTENQFRGILNGTGTNFTLEGIPFFGSEKRVPNLTYTDVERFVTLYYQRDKGLRLQPQASIGGDFFFQDKRGAYREVKASITYDEANRTSNLTIQISSGRLPATTKSA